MPGNTAASQRYMTFSKTRLPAVGTWVTVKQASGDKSRSIRRSAVSSTPALVSSVSEGGLITVLYPNKFVLQHNFKGEPLKRVSGLTANQLRPFTGTDLSLQILEKALCEAVKAHASSPQRAMRPSLMDQCFADEEEENSVNSVQTVAKESAEAVRERSRSRSPARRPTTSSDPHSPVFETPPRRRLTRKMSAETTPALETADESKNPVPVAPAVTAASVKLSSDGAMAAKAVQEAASPLRNRETMARFTKVVAHAFMSVGPGKGSPRRLPREELEAELGQGGFSAKEIAAGLSRLDSRNKICLCDGLVFRM